MPIFCRGDEEKQQLVEDYEIVPISRCTLLSGQSRQGCARELTREYYIFQATHRQSGKQEIFYAGNSTGPALLSLIGHPSLPLTDPFPPNDGDARSERGANGQGRVDGQDARRRLSPLNMQLSRAIDLACMLWDVQPGPLFAPLKTRILATPSEDIDPHSVERFNLAIGKFDKSLEQKLSDAAAVEGRTPSRWNFRELEEMVAWTGPSNLFPSQAPPAYRRENIAVVRRVSTEKNYALCEMTADGRQLFADIPIFADVGGPVPNAAFHCYLGFRGTRWKITRVLARADL
ncbi:hypothetical protein O9X99_00095 [Agrobacterium salinitolerans]|uniref:Uncharacterized protein n=1 Tax=Agrobacterium salinitolerans TaxID=1183413 RepID=A0ABY3BYU2_9HYPH|nr:MULTISPECIES: hypothetical protein [Agrobacterium]MCZ7890067.1 hypothetical protein [Agrobacterium salinitolerans]TRA97239.1 hypothetical protein EXN23_03170 [Agrobacterium salinitolerans]